MLTPPRENISANLINAAFIAAFFCAIAWAQGDDEAARQDAEAISSREFAGRQVCGPNATPEWLDDKHLQCLKHVDAPVLVAGGKL
jgi:hypothetical protein